MVLMNNLVGKQVYNNASYAPSQGTNEPQGYINRGVHQASQNNQGQGNQGQGNQGNYGGVSTIGNDGQSDTRSGLAQQALQGRLQQGGMQQQGTPSNTSPTVANGLGSNLPQIQISPIGELKLPFNFKYAQAVLGEKQTADSAILKLQQSRQADLAQYMTSLRESAGDYDDTRLDSLNDASSRGVSFSSGYGKRIGSDATNYNNLLSALNSQETGSAQGATSQRAAINDAFKAALSRYANQAGFDLDQNAGTYHLKKK